MKYTIFFLLMITFFSCNTKNEELIVSKTNFALTQNKVEENADTNISYKEAIIDLNDLKGTYEGIFPCTKCNGIHTIITLYPNKTYYLEMDHIGSNMDKIKEWGEFEWVDNENYIYLKNDKKMEFTIGEGRIWLVKSLNIDAIKLGNNTNFILQKK